MNKARIKANAENRALELVESLAALMARVNGHLGKNPYCIAEYKHSLRLLAEITGMPDKYDVNVNELRNITQD